MFFNKYLIFKFLQNSNSFKNSFKLAIFKTNIETTIKGFLQQYVTQQDNCIHLYSTYNNNIFKNHAFLKTNFSEPATNKSVSREKC